MHPFLWAGLVLHATGLAVLGFFVLFAASKSEGIVKTIGTILGGWIFVLIVLGVIGAAAFGGHFGPMMRDHWGRGPWNCPAPPSAPGTAP